VVKNPISDIRKRYIVRLVLRCIILTAVTLLVFTDFAPHDILQGFAFFQRFSWMHLLWIVWVLDMLHQLYPAKNIALGSHKYLKERFKPVLERISKERIKAHVLATTRAAYKVMLLWVALIAALGALKFAGVLQDKHLFLISVTFYVCDLICVLIWCPFRLMMGNKCCTTCRIFNWDHLMMFTPMVYVMGFFSLSLVFMSVAIWIIWELCVMIYPERFWEKSNAALKCSECTDKLCTQYCQKLRKK
jgi:hypothetical protein